MIDVQLCGKVENLEMSWNLSAVSKQTTGQGNVKEKSCEQKLFIVNLTIAEQRLP